MVGVSCEKKEKTKGTKKERKCEGGRATRARVFLKEIFKIKIFTFFHFFYTSATHSSASKLLAAAYRIAYVSPSRSSTVLEPSGSTSTVPVNFFGFFGRKKSELFFPFLKKNRGKKSLLTFVRQRSHNNVNIQVGPADHVPPR